MEKIDIQTQNQQTPLIQPIQTPMYPFQNSFENFVQGCGDYILKEESIKILEKVFGLPVNKSNLKAFLARECNIPDPTHFSFPDIIAALKLHLEKNCSKSPNTQEQAVAKKKEPLSNKACAVLELLQQLPPHKGLTGPQILNELDQQNILIDQSTLTKSIIPALKPHGVKNKPRIGYYIDK